jgi:hypothetical protein
MRKLRTYTVTHHHIALTALCLAVISIILAVTMVTKLHAESYDVTAKVSAALPATPAFITSPFDGEHVSTALITVSGTCPSASYVTVYRDGILSGMSPCIGNTFSMQLSLTPGANQLLAKVYNVTNDEGPASPPITVFYDTANPPTPPIPEINGLGVDFVETTPYQPGIIYRTSSRPTISGHAPVDSTVTIAFKDSSFTCKTKSDPSGRWTCTLASTLPDGTYLVEVSAVTPGGTTLRVSPFYIVVSKAVTSLIPALQGPPLTVSCLCTYQTHRPGELWKWDIIINGGAPPYNVTIDWGDGTKATILNSPARPLVTHTFKQPGKYAPFIRVTDSAGNSASLQLYAPVVGDAVDVDPAPTAPIPLSTVLVFMPPVVGVAIIMGLGVRKLFLYILSKLT